MLLPSHSHPVPRPASPPSQVPGAVTISASQYCHVLPCELAGWVVRRLQLQADVPWLLVITTDPSARLAAALLTRLTVLTNCVCGFPT